MLPPISTRFQTISLVKADECDHLPPADDPLKTIFTASRQRLNRKDWRNIHFICLNKLEPNHQVLTPSPPSCEQRSIPQRNKPPTIPPVITPVDSRMSQSQQRDLSPQLLASIPPAVFLIFTDCSARDGI